VARPNPSGFAEGTSPPAGSIDEVVFAGPLDKLHGLRVFVRALTLLPPTIPVGFVGPDRDLDGAPASWWVRERVKGRRGSVHEHADWSAIIGYLRGGNRLAVVPYLSAPDLEFVRELARHRIPFLVSDFGPAPELVTDPDARTHLLFPPSSTQLARALTDYLATPLDRRRAWVNRLAAAHDPQTTEAVLGAFYTRLLTEARARRAAPTVAAAPVPRPKVTVGITHYNLGRFLPATLASIAAQSYPNLEVVVADDGSTDPASVAVVEQMQRHYPTFRFLRGPNLGVCGNRNRCLEAATGELFFPLDADNVAAPQMIEQLVDALQRQPEGVGAVSCFWLGFTDDADLGAGRYCGAYRPTGGPRVAVGLWNPYGETSGLFRTAQLRQLGGYEDLHPEYMSEDWHLYIKLAGRGLRVAVVPRALYYYRIRPDSRYRTGDHAVNHLRVLPDVAAIPFSPAERLEIWTLLASMMHVTQHTTDCCRALEKDRDALVDRLRARRYRLIDGVVSALRPLAALRRAVRRVGGVRRVWGRLMRRGVVSGVR
jgi:glycosyltransferase involved in cell wall biosynthesis